jgi:hypothetical protein
MGSSEFTVWRAFMDEHELGADRDVQRWAMLMAAAHNGALTRKDKRLWRAADFMPAKSRVVRKASTGADARAFVSKLKKPTG